MSIRISTFIAGLSVLAGLLLVLSPLVVEPPAGTSANILRTAGAVVMAIGLWATGAFPPYFTSILFLFISIALSLAPPKVIFSGFSSSAVWLVFGGLVLGVAVHKTGLGRRAVSLMLRHFPVSYRGTIWAIVLVGAVLAFFIPSAVGRVMLLVPIVLALADRLGFGAKRNGRTGMVLAAGMGTMIPAFSILPSNVPNMGLIGASESVYGISYTYGEYFVLNYPVMGTFAIVAMALLICRMFPDEPSRNVSDEPASPWTAAERRLMFVLALALGLWVTDFLHGIAPAWIALGAAILCLLPVVGVLPPNALARDIDYGPWFFVAGIIGLGAIVTETGLGSAIAKALFSVIPLEQGANAQTFASLFGVGMIVGIFTTLPASPGIMTPLADGIAAATGWPVKSILLTQVPTWIIFPIPYQAPPIVVTLALGAVGILPALRLLLVYAIIAIVVMLPVQYLWGQWLGVYP